MNHHNITTLAKRICDLHSGSTSLDTIMKMDPSEVCPPRALLNILLETFADDSVGIGNFYKKYGLCDGRRNTDWALALYLYRVDGQFKQSYHAICNELQAVNDQRQAA